MNKYFKYELALVITVSFLSIATTVLANGPYSSTWPDSVDQPYFGGPYMGIGIGGIHNDIDVENNDELIIKDSHIFKAIKFAHNFNMTKFGFNANVFAGYGRTFRSFYFGAELFEHYFSPQKEGTSEYYDKDYDNIRNVIINISTKVKNNYSFGGDMRAGYLATPKAMIYILFGLDCAFFEVKNEFWIKKDNDIPLPYPFEPTYVSDSFHKWKVGYIPGFGIETGITAHVSLRAQYTYTLYPSFGHTAAQLTKQQEDSVGDVIQNTKIKPNRGLFTTELSYLF